MLISIFFIVGTSLFYLRLYYIGISPVNLFLNLIFKRLYWIYPNRRFFVSREQSRTWAEIPHHAKGEVRLLPAFEEGGVAFPPLTLSPQDTLTCWEEDIDAYRVHTPTAQPANQPSMPKWESSSFPADDFLEQPNQKEERNVDQIQKQRTREIL